MTATATRHVEPLAHRRFTVSDYYAMADKGILAPGERVELLDGEIIQMTPIGPDHGGTTDELTAAFSGLLNAGQVVMRVQGTVRLDDYSEPQPDLLLLRPREGGYRRTQPTPDDVLLLVEVSDTSLAKDQGLKLSLYAKAGIAEVWIIDLSQRRLVAYAEPSGGRYRSTRRYGRDGHVAPRAFPDLSIAIRKLVG